MSYRTGNIFIKTLIALSIIVIVGTLLITTHPRNNTDPADGRSGLSLYTDNLTGCQYLGTYHSLTPRLDQNGKQICNTANQITNNHHLSKNRTAIPNDKH